MDLITYLKNTNNEELYQKLKTIVKLYEERENSHRNLIKLNDEYNRFLTEKQKRESKEKNKDDNLFSKLKTINPLLLFFLLIWLPTPILIIVCIGINILSIIRISRIITKMREKAKEEFIDEIKSFDQDLKYEQLCKIREQYHPKRKELDSALLSICKEDMDLINDFYGALQEYEDLLFLLTCDLEEKVKLPESEISLSLNKNTNC